MSVTARQVRERLSAIEAQYGRRWLWERTLRLEASGLSSVESTLQLTVVGDGPFPSDADLEAEHAAEDSYD